MLDMGEGRDNLPWEEVKKTPLIWKGQYSATPW